MLNKIVIFLSLVMLSGCGLKFKSNNVPKGNFTFHKIMRHKKFDKQFVINFSSDIDYRKYKIFQFVCLPKNNMKITNQDFDSSHMAGAKYSGIMFYYMKGESSIKKQSNLFTYTMRGFYYQGTRYPIEKSPVSYTDETIKAVIPDKGLTCAFYNSYPLTFKKRYISNPMIIPKEDFVKILK